MEANCGEGAVPVAAIVRMAARARGRRIGAALVESAAIFELAARVVAEEIRRAHRPIGSCRGLALVVQIRKRETV